MDLVTTVLLLLFISVKSINGDVSVDTTQEEERDPTGWSSTKILRVEQQLVDPTGWNYDRESKTTIRSGERGDMIGFCNSLVYNENIENHNGELKNQIKTTVYHQYSASKSNDNIAFVRRFINLLLDSAGLPDKYKNNGEDMSGVVELKMTGKQYETLIRFSQSLENISFGELDSVLSTSMYRGYQSSMEDIVDKILFTLSQKEYWLPFVIIAMALIFMRKIASSKSVSGLIASVVLLMFVASYCIEYYRMYKDVEIKQRIILDKHQNIPGQCLAGNKFWLWSMKDSIVAIFTTKSDECEQYHKATLLDPLVEVSPVRVLSSILADIILHPANKLGLAVSDYYISVTGKLSFFSGIIVWIVSSVGIFIVASICFIIILGGSLRLGNMFGGLSISSNGKPILSSPKPAQEITPSVAASPHPSISTISSNGNYFLVDANTLRMMLSAGPSNRIEDLSTKPSAVEASTSNAAERGDLKAESTDDQNQAEKKDYAKSLEIVNLDSLNRDDLRTIIKKCKTELSHCASESVANTSQDVQLNETNTQKEMNSFENVLDTNEIQ